MPERGHARLTLLVALADDELVIGHRHSEWTGWAPAVEADLAFSSIAQDEMAHAQLYYELAEPIDGRTPDQLALGRHPAEYRHAVVCERANGGPGSARRASDGLPAGGDGDWGYTLARQYLYDTADDVRLGCLESSSWTELAEIVAVIRLEERYHLDHAATWLRRLTGHSAEARAHLQGGFDAVATEAPALFEPLWEEESLVETGVLAKPSTELEAEWRRRVAGELAAVGLEPPAFGDQGRGGRVGTRSEDFTALWEDMTGLYRAHAGARW